MANSEALAVCHDQNPVFFLREIFLHDRDEFPSSSQEEGRGSSHPRFFEREPGEVARCRNWVRAPWPDPEEALGP